MDEKPDHRSEEAYSVLPYNKVNTVVQCVRSTRSRHLSFLSFDVATLRIEISPLFYKESDSARSRVWKTILNSTSKVGEENLELGAYTTRGYFTDNSFLSSFITWI